MLTDEIHKQLFSLQDKKYRDFQVKLIPSVDPETVIGVRTPELRKLAKLLGKDERIGEFLNDLPHRYFDENQLHAFIISEIKDYDACMGAVCRFLPHVDNWATCDQMSPKVFKKHRPELLVRIREWLNAEHSYTVRFALGMLMQHFLDEDFVPDFLEMAASVRSDEYYINMMIAWYFATALAKQWDSTLPLIKERRLDLWTHSKTIQKAVESNRIGEEQKTLLRGLRRGRE